MSVLTLCCDSCGKAIKTSERHAGKKGKCPACGATVQVPLTPTVAVSVPSPAEAPELSRLAACVDCGRQVSKAAQVCPSCGRTSFQPNRFVALALAWTLGGIGIHKFYLRRQSEGVQYLVLCTTLLPALAAFLDGFTYLFVSDEKFSAKYGTTLYARAPSAPSLTWSGAARWAAGIMALALGIMSLIAGAPTAVILFGLPGLLSLPPIWDRISDETAFQFRGHALSWWLLTASGLLIVGVSPFNRAEGLGGKITIAMVFSMIGLCIIPGIWEHLKSCPRIGQYATPLRLVMFAAAIAICILADIETEGARAVASTP